MVVQRHRYAYGRVHQIVTEAAALAGVIIPDGVDAVRILRHFGAVASRKPTGNPKS